MSRSLFVVLSFLITMQLYAMQNGWEFSKTFKLKKDQIAQIQIKKGTSPSFKREGELFFRWTLFHNERLVVLLSYEGTKKQYILQKEFGRQTIKLFLQDDYMRIDKRPFVIINFLAFESAKKEATLQTLIKDPTKRLEFKVVKPIK